MIPTSFTDHLYARIVAGLPLPTIAGGAPEDDDPPQDKDKGPDLVKAVENLLAKHGGPDRALSVLLSENYEYRDQIRDLKKQLPAAGSIVLSGDDVKAWETYTGLGKPTEVRKALEDGQRAATEATSLRKAGLVRDAAELHGFKPTVLATLVEKLDIVIVDGKGKDGKPVREAHIKGEGDSTTPLPEFAEKHWGEFLPALRPESKSPPKGTPPRFNGNGTPPVNPTERPVKVMF